MGRRMSAYRAVRSIWLSLFSVAVVVFFVRQLSFDFEPIVGYFDEVAKLKSFWDVISYSFSGNMVAGVFLEYLVLGDGVEKAMWLYALAAGVRCFIFTYFVSPRYAVFGIFASFVILELNQARLSLALSALFIFLRSGHRLGLLASALSHLSVLPVLPLYQFKFKRLLFPFFGLVVLLVLVSAGIFPRYFAGSRGSGVPLNTILYFSFASYFYYWLWVRGEYVHDFMFFLFFASLIFALTHFGFSSVYVGRISELCWHISVFRFLLTFSGLIEGGGDDAMSKARAEVVMFGACSLMVVLGLYRLLLLDGNIWSYF